MDNKLSKLDYEETKETVEILYEISQILNCGLNREALGSCLSLIEAGVNPEALCAVIKELKKAGSQ